MSRMLGILRYLKLGSDDECLPYYGTLCSVPYHEHPTWGISTMRFLCVCVSVARAYFAYCASILLCSSLAESSLFSVSGPRLSTPSPKHGWFLGLFDFYGSVEER